MKTYKYAAIVGTLGQLQDRYMRCGYKTKDSSFEEILANLQQMDFLSGIELSYESKGVLSDATYVKKELDKTGFVPTYVNSSLFGERIWANGSLTSSDRDIRNKAIDSVLKGLEFTKTVGAEGFNLWLGQDGFDYPFQTDYIAQLDWLVDALKTIANYIPTLKITIEPKMREPRNRSLIDTVSTALLICSEVGCSNLGVTIDIGHTLQAGQNIAQNIEMASRNNRLFNIHVNDNYGVWDDDMIVGSVHLMEYLEMMYSLTKVKYNGWITVDIFPFRENSLDATRESVAFMKKYAELINRIGFENINDMIKNGDVPDTLKAIREAIFR